MWSIVWCKYLCCVISQRSSSNAEFEVAYLFSSLFQSVAIMARTLCTVENCDRRVFDLKLFVEIPDLPIPSLPHHFNLRGSSRSKEKVSAAPIALLKSSWSAKAASKKKQQPEQESMCPYTRNARSWHEHQGSCVYQHIQDIWGFHDLHFPSLCQEMDNHSTFGFQDIRWSPSGHLVERVRKTSKWLIIQPRCLPKLCWTAKI